MKICILSIMNLKHMTLSSLYTDYFDRSNIKYDIICVDKYGASEQSNANKLYAYRMNIKRDWPVYRKVLEYLKFRFYALRILNENDYDFVIVWNSYTAFLFSDYLKRKKNRRFSINIRDYAGEKNPLVFALMRSILGDAAFTTISSDGFKSFLPSGEYITVHSLNESLLSKQKIARRTRTADDPIRISFIGYVRFFEIDKKVLDAFGNDERFIIQFFGEGSQLLQEYATKQGYRNVRFHGRFEPEQTLQFLNETDVMNNLYGVGNIALDTALSIKAYHAAYIGIPILVFENTYMEQVATKYGFGYVVSDFAGLPDRFYEWYRNVDYDQLVAACDRFVRDAQHQNRFFEEILMRYFPG